MRARRLAMLIFLLERAGRRMGQIGDPLCKAFAALALAGEQLCV